MGEIIGVLTNPAETVKSLTESKRLLDEMRQELSDQKERAQIRTRHTFSQLPGFFPRQAEITALERALSGEPSFTVLFGASSVGKTALLRQVLSHERYHVLHFDLRIAGFADLSSLYMSLSQQMEQYFEEVARQLEGYDEFQREAWGFKHDRLSVERRIADSSERVERVRTSDIARLMEMFQSSLLKYWEFEPEMEGDNSGGKSKHDRDASSERTHVEAHAQPPKSHFRWPSFGKRRRQNGGAALGIRSQDPNTEQKEDSEKPKKEKPIKKMPVIFFDEAHKLPALIRSTETMKCLLDSMLVLTKQDRLCHVIHATSDPFYQTWLRQLNIMQHCKIVTIGDCSKAEARAYFHERILPRVPEEMHRRLDFEHLYEALGGKLAHWHDFITDFVNSNGRLTVKKSSHFLQAHALLNLHLVHSASQLAPHHASEDSGKQPNAHDHAGFKIYSPITHPTNPNARGGDPDEDFSPAPSQAVDFTAIQLLKVLSRLAQPDVTHLPYFALCRDLGVRAVDGMIKGRVLDLRWTDVVTKEGLGIGGDEGSYYPPQQQERRQEQPYGSGVGHAQSTQSVHAFGSDETVAIPSPTFESHGGMHGHDGLGSPPPIQSEQGTPYNEGESGFIQSERGDGYRQSGGEGTGTGYRQSTMSGAYADSIHEVVGPRVLATTPVMRYAMRAVVEEYEDVQSVSEYASLSDVDEY